MSNSPTSSSSPYQAQINDLLAQKSFIEKINNVLPSVVYIFDLKTQSIVYVNEQVREIFGLAPEEFKKMGSGFYNKVMHPDDIPNLIKQQGRVIQIKDTEIVEIEYRVKDHANKYRWVSDRITVFSRDQGHPHMVLGVCTDIHDRKQADEELKNTLGKMNLSLEAVQMGTWEWDAKLAVLYWDRRMKEIHGVPPLLDITATEVIQKLMLPEDWIVTAQKSFEALEKKQDFSVTYRISLNSGEIRHIRSFGKYMHDHEQDRMSGVAWDVTEEVKAEQEMAEARASMISSTKMAALGEMSGGIAHEINNPLTVIQARAFQLSQMIESGKLEPAKIQQAAEAISRTADKISRIINSLRSFSRDGAHDPFDLVPVQQLIDETLEFCRTRFYNHSVEVTLDSLPEDLEVECRLVQIEQVLLNLLNNSFDAIQELPEKWIRIAVKDLQESLQIRVMDSGPGIPAAVLDKIMHPFFTTKEVGKGTGLGLSISTGIIKSHGGMLFVDTQEPHTTFVIHLPKMQKAQET